MKHTHDPVHFDMAKQRSCWICMTCKDVLGYTGLAPTKDEIEVLVAFVLSTREQLKESHANGFVRLKSVEPVKTKGNEMSNLAKDLTAAHLNGLKSSVHALEVQITILKTLLNGEGAETETDDEELEAKPAKKGRAKKAAALEDDEDEVVSDDAPETNEDEDDDFVPKKTKGKKAASFEDDEIEVEETDDEEDEEKPAKAKAKKPAKLTIDDVNDACMERAGRTTRAEVLGILKTKFKVKSVTDLKPEQYDDVIKAMKGKK